jgi:hypothetical protein
MPTVAARDVEHFGLLVQLKFRVQEINFSGSPLGGGDLLPQFDRKPLKKSLIPVFRHLYLLRKAVVLIVVWRGNQGGC